MKKFKRKLLNRKYAYRVIENDTAYVGKIFLKKQTGKITLGTRRALIKYLKNITESEIDSTKLIVLNFFFKPKSKPNGNCIDFYTSDIENKQYFKKSTKDIQFFITQKDYNCNKKNVTEDKGDFIRSLFFKYHFICGNYIIIKNNGSFLRHYGEYRQDKISEKINSKW